MTMHKLSVLLLALGALCGAQTFEVADIHPSPPSPWNDWWRSQLKGRYEIHNATVLDLITIAYGVESETVFGGPTQLTTDRFEVTAKIPPKATRDELKQPLRALLEERFGLVTHGGTQPLTVFALTQSKGGAKLTHSAGDGAGSCDSDRVEGPPIVFTYTCRNTSMAEFAAKLRSRDSNRLNHPIADLTELKGAFDFTLQYATVGTINDATTKGLPVSPSILEALEKLGLHLELRKAPYPVLLVDAVNRVPTPNAPDVAKNLPPAQTEFEAADVKPSEATEKKGKLNPGGRLDLQGYTLKDLIKIGFDLVYDALIVDCPKWMTAARYDIVAKAPGTGVDVGPMIRTLIVDRFSLETHTEDRTMPVYALVAGRTPKLTPADLSARSDCKISVAQAGSGSAAVPLKTATCTNTTMAEFAQRLHSIAPAYVDRPVVDQTGIRGAYDFVVSFTTKNIVGFRKDPSDDPSGAMTVFEAIEKELGLKVDGSKKAQVPVLVIDRAEQIVR